MKYNKLNQLEVFSEKAGSESHKSEYAYDRDNRVTGITYDGSSHRVNYTYDELGRVATRLAECGADAGKLTSTYEYVDGGYGTNSTTPLVKKITQNGVSFEYAYDTLGNIISEKRGTLTTTYAYDALGQLIRVNDPHENATWVYNYDRGGNITSKVKYAYTTGTLGSAQQTIPYVYGDSNWKDKLTSYNGQTITYDAIGNPLNDGTWTYTWNAGRQLKQMSKSGTTVQFKYDHNGLRVGKVVNGTETKYQLHGKLIMHMTVGEDNLHFFYDAQSRPAKVSYNGVLYTYVHNLQGDVVGLLDNAGTLVVEYKYDAWGKPLSTTSTLADTLGKRNPFRYRDYVYDEETELYYLRSRYYKATVGRFINNDTVIAQYGTILTQNAFSYCRNSCVNLFDPTGETAVAAGTAIGVGGFSKIVEIVGAAIIWGLSNLLGNTQPMEASSSNTSSKTVSNSVDWDVSDNKKNHIVHGSKKGGGHDWNKFNIDPNDPNAWSKILPLLKEVIDSGKQIDSYPTPQGTIVEVYIKYFAEYGTSIIVNLYSDTPGVMFISDAYPVR